jgi:aromatic ring hydroxylase
MTDAPDKIWAEPDGETLIIHNVDPDLERFIATGYLHEYTRTDISQARIAELEDLIGRYANSVANANGVYFEPAGPDGEYIIGLAELEAANDAAEQSGQNSDGGLWRFWADKSLELATKNAALQKEIESLKETP